jgi:hypothetical protein
MKKLMTFCLLFIVAFSLQAQSEMDEISAEICKCINGKDYKVMNSVEANQLVEVCITEVTISHISFFMEGVDENNLEEGELVEVMEKKGEAVGIHAAKNCPAFLKLMAIIANTKEEGNSASLQEQKETILVGEFTAFNTEEFFSANLVEANGREHKLYWMEHFEGAMKLKNDQKQSIGKTVELSYKEVESYNPQLQNYSPIKVITGIIWK